MLYQKAHKKTATNFRTDQRLYRHNVWHDDKFSAHKVCCYCWGNGDKISI